MVALQTLSSHVFCNCSCNKSICCCPLCIPSSKRVFLYWLVPGALSVVLSCWLQCIRYLFLICFVRRFFLWYLFSQWSLNQMCLSPLWVEGEPWVQSPFRCMSLLHGYSAWFLLGFLHSVCRAFYFPWYMKFHYCSVLLRYL